MTGYDLAIVGAGPGGYTAALRAAQAGARVCLVEQDRVGGTCLQRGCIPTKALYHTALTLQRLRRIGEQGIDIGAAQFDLGRAMVRKDGIVQTLTTGIEQLLKAAGVDLLCGRAMLEEGGVRVALPGAQLKVRAGKIILATGARPVVPQLLAASGKNLLTSNEILDIKELPRTLTVIGGGYIGCELAGIFASFGSRVTLLEALPTLLARNDRQAVREIERGLQDLSVEIRTGVAVTATEELAAGVRLQLAEGPAVEAEKVLVAVGRVPNSSGLGLEALGIRTDRQAVVVDERLRTSHADVYAIGDVTGGIQLAHVASWQAGIAVANALGGDVAVGEPLVPSVVFGFPELAQVGLDEAECKRRQLAVKIGRFVYQASGKALCNSEPRGLVKIVAAQESGRILGAVVAGAEASALIAEVAVAMRGNLTAAELGAVIHAHPTLPELVMEAAEDVNGLSVHKPGRRVKYKD